MILSDWKINTGDKLKIVIPAAGIGSRMLPYTKYRSKAMLRVGDKAAISYILDLYKSHEFVILLGHCGDQIKEYCKAAHPELIKHKSIKFIEVDDYKSDSASTLYSLSKAQEFLQEPFIIHCCDTILLSDDFLDGDFLEYDDCILISNSTRRLYTKVTQRDSEVATFLYDEYDKGCTSSFDNFDYMGVCKISEYRQFWKLTNVLLTNPDNNLSDVDVLSKMHVHLYVDYIHKDDWIDIGNIDEYESYNSSNLNSKNVLYKESEDIFIVNNNVIKFSINIDDTKNKIQRAQTTPLQLHTPILNYTGKYIFSYKFVDGQTLSKTLYNDSFKIGNFLDWYRDRFYINSNLDSRFNDTCYQFYIDKTFDRLRKIDFLDINEDVTINGVHVPKITSQLETLTRFSFLYNGIKSHFHGDLVLDNIIDVGNNDYVLIDWRSSFQGDIEFGDYYYDIAKLGHSLIMNHDMLCNKYFSYTELGDEYIVDYTITNHMKDSLNSFYTWCVDNKLSVSKIKLLMGLIWINMSPLHGPDIGKFLYRYGCYHIQNLMWEIRHK